MCGIVGVIQKNNYGFYSPQEDTFFQMLYADALRGPDSTGVIAVERQGHFHIAKEAVESTWVIPQIKAETFFKDKMTAAKPEGKAWIGHNRKTTVGKTTDENAHPFVINGEFALVHNGTLHNHEQLAKTDVDSKALAIVLHEAMGKENWKEALEETLGKVYGAYACAWYDARHGKLFLLRNNQRPLSIIETPTSFFWASEPMMAWWILARNGVKNDDMKHIQLQEHHLVSFDIENTKLEVTELTPKKASAPASQPIRKAGATSGSKHGEEGTDEESVHWTKSQRKNFRHAWVDRVIRFWADDYVECNHPKTLMDGETEVFLFGGHEEILRPHTVRCQVDLGRLGMRYKEDILERMWRGKVTQVDFDKKTGHVSLWIDEAKPVVASLPTPVVSKPPFPTHPYKPLTDQENRVKMMKTHYEKTFGELKEERTVDGKLRLIATQGINKDRIIYETPIALH